MDNFIRYKVTENLTPELKLLDIWAGIFIKLPILPHEVWVQINAIQNQNTETTKKTIFFGESEIVSSTKIYQIGESVKIHDETYIVENLVSTLSCDIHFDMTVYKKSDYDKRCEKARPLIVDILMTYQDREIERLVEEERLRKSNIFRKLGIFKSTLDFFRKWNQC